MSEIETLRNRGRLAEARDKAANLRLKLGGLRAAMRENLDEFAVIEELPLDLVAQQALEAAELAIELTETLAHIKALEKALGR